MRQFFLFAALFFFINTAQAQPRQKYSRAKIYFDAAGHNMRTLSATGIATDHGEHKKNTFFISDFSVAELERAQKAGFKTEIIIDDVSKHYREQNKKKGQKSTAGASCDNNPAIDIPAHFHLGTYGGYFTYAEMQEILDSMQLLYPALISVRQPIDTFLTIEGRPIFWVRISDNPGVEQPLKPQMLVTAVHHAREPGSLSATIFYLWYLLEHYATDPQIKAIIDNTELYFVPCINPDGYLTNETSDPSGGGMWRKNLRRNPDGSFGVDINRNYGYEWGHDDIGSSPMPSSETYRGVAAFSEPETRAVKWLAEQHNFKLNLNYHTYNNDFIYPWGYIASLQTDDSDVYFNYSSFITQYNNYRYGTCDQTLNYITNGGSDDWMYGEASTKNKILAWTPEIGKNEFGFYTPIENIIPDCKNNLRSNVNTAALLLPYATVRPTDPNILFDAAGQLHYSLQRLGIPDSATFTVSYTSLDARLSLSAAPKLYTGLTLLEQATDSLSYNIAVGTSNGAYLRYVIQVNNGYYSLRDTVGFYYGEQHSLTLPANASLTGWDNTGWSVSTSIFRTAPASLQSKTAGAANYNNNALIDITTSDPIDLTFSREAWLEFYARWGIEASYDYVMVSASVAGSGIWSHLCGKYTRPGTRYQSLNDPIYDGQQPFWVQEKMDLSEFLGQKVQIRFQLVSDAGGTEEGFFADDMEVRTVQDTPLAIHTTAQAAMSMQLYPSPAKDVINIMIKNFAPEQITDGTMYDATGRKVRSIFIDRPQSNINISGLAAGIYYIKMNGTASLPVQKIVVAQ